MGLKGKMIAQTEVKHSGVGDAFHDLFAKRPHDVPNSIPQHIQGFTLLDGELGVAGCKVLWNYYHDGKDSVATHIFEKIDEENQTMEVRVIEGDVMEFYKSFEFKYHVDTKGEDNLITFTIEYEKLKEDSPHPGTLLNLFLQLIEGIEAHHTSSSTRVN